MTMPLKEVALDVADEVAPVAATIGAANTLVRLTDGSWRADNTDAPGMVALRLAGGRGDRRRPISVLGAGGTARAALVAAREFAAQTVTVYARRPEAIDEASPGGRQSGPEPDRPTVHRGRPGWCRRRGHLDAAEGRGRSTGPAAALAVGCGTPSDAIYDPWPTPLAAAAADAGCHIVSGLDLLLTQAVRQFELFTGVDAPVEAPCATPCAKPPRPGDRTGAAS